VRGQADNAGPVTGEGEKSGASQQRLIFDLQVGPGENRGGKAPFVSLRGDQVKAL
jgi:hypothetical protein